MKLFRRNVEAAALLRPGGGLAGAAGAKNGHKFVVPQVQTDVVQCVLHQLAGLIFFVDLFELEHKCAFPVLRRRALLPVV